MVKTIRNHGSPDNLAATYVLECLGLHNVLPTVFILLVASKLIHESFCEELVPNSLFRGTTRSCEVVEEPEYDQVTMKGTIHRAYYRGDEEFPSHHTTIRLDEFTDMEYSDEDEYDQLAQDEG
jgi:hypothetical protein